MSTINFHVNQVSIVAKQALSKRRKFERAQATVEGLHCQVRDSYVALQMAQERGQGGQAVGKALKMVAALTRFNEELDVNPEPHSYKDVYIPAREEYARAYYQAYGG